MLVGNDEAREVMLESQILMPIMVYLSSENIQVRALWFEAIKELCAHSAFRKQFENTPTCIAILKRAIRTTES